MSGSVGAERYGQFSVLPISGGGAAAGVTVNATPRELKLFPGATRAEGEELVVYITSNVDILFRQGVIGETLGTTNVFILWKNTYWPVLCKKGQDYLLYVRIDQDGKLWKGHTEPA